MSRSEGLGARVSWSLVDQGLSSATNFALIVVVANAVDQEAFGAFGLALAAFQISLGFSRALAGETLAVRHSDAEPAARHEQGRGATAAAGLTGLVVAVAVAVATAVLWQLDALDGDAAPALLVLAAVLPALLVQDAFRFVCFVDRRPDRATAIDAVWTGVQVLTLGLGFALGVGSAGFVAAWGIAGAASAAFARRLTGVLPSPRRAVPYLREHRDLGPRFAVESLATAGVPQLVFVIVVSVAGLSAGGAYRGGLALFGPLRVVLQGLAAVVVPEGVRRAGDPRGLRRLVGAAAAANVAVAAAAGLIYLLGPDRIGSFMLGDTWPAASDLLVPFTLATMASGATAGAVYGLRALAAARESLRTQIVIGLVVIAACWIGVVVDGAAGAAWMLAAAQGLGAAVMWTVLIVTQRSGAVDVEASTAN